MKPLQKAVALLLIGLAAGRGAWAADALPVPWDGMDIGGVALAGGARYGDGTFTLTAGAGDIGGTSDRFHFVYQSVTGDFALIARVASVAGPSDSAKAGLMVRDALAATVEYAGLFRTPSRSLLAQSRPSYQPQSISGAADGPFTSAVWLRLVKRGTTVDTYAAPDHNGSPGTWHKVGGDTPIPSGMVYAGLCLTGHSPGASATAIFDHVTLSTGPQPALDDGVYTLVPASAPGMALSVVGAEVALAASADVPFQKWLITQRPGGQYDIQPEADHSLALTVARAGSADGTKVVVQADAGQLSQRWSVIANGNGTYGLVPQCAPGHALDDFGGNATPAAVIDIWTRWATDPHTQWNIIPAP